MCFRRFIGALGTVAMAVTLAACNIGQSAQPTENVEAIYTSAAQTMGASLGAQETGTAAVASPTLPASPTPLASVPALPTFAIATGSVPFGTPAAGFTPGATPLPAGTQAGGLAVGCNNASWLADTVGPSDKSTVTAGKEFKKGWSIQNTGTCSWDAGYGFDYVSGDQLGGNNIAIADSADFTDPGHSQTFIIKLTAPTTAGEYKGFWQMKAPDGTWFGSQVFFDVIVK